jgi:curved DNA-binding protein CbpA
LLRNVIMGDFLHGAKVIYFKIQFHSIFMQLGLAVIIMLSALTSFANSEFEPFQGKNLYELLGISQNSTSDEIKFAFREQIKIYNPNLAANTKVATAIIRANAVLSKPDIRNQYDQWLKNGGSSSTQANSQPAPAASPKSSLDRLQELNNDLTANAQRAFNQYGATYTTNWVRHQMVLSGWYTALTPKEFQLLIRVHLGYLKDFTDFRVAVLHGLLWTLNDMMEGNYVDHKWILADTRSFINDELNNSQDRTVKAALRRLLKLAYGESTLKQWGDRGKAFCKTILGE